MINNNIKILFACKAENLENAMKKSEAYQKQKKSIALMKLVLPKMLSTIATD